MSVSAAIADSLLRQAFGQWARPSDPYVLMEAGALLIGCPQLLRTLVSRRGPAISRRTVMNHAGQPQHPID